MAFVSITLMMYTGSLFNHIFWASSPHSQKFTEPLAQTIEDIISDPDANYGTIRGGSTMGYFMNSKGSMFEKVYTYLDSIIFHLPYHDAF